MAARTRIRKAAAAPRNDGGFLRGLLLIAAAAFLLRLGVSWELAAINGGHNSVFTPSQLTDLATYMRLGREMAEFRYSGEFYYQPFYYAVFLPAAYLLSGGSVWFVIVLQALLGAATSLLAGAIAGRLFGRTGGYVAAALTAISTPLLLYTPFHQNETLQTFNLALLFFLALTACRRHAFRWWCATGAVAGIAILTRGNAWFFVPGILAALLLADRRRRLPARRTLAAAGIFLGMTLLVQLPFAWHNTRVTGKLSGPSTAADAVLALGNSIEAPAGGRDPELPAGPMEYPAAYGVMMERSRAGVPVARQMWEWMVESPGAFFELQFRKLLLFWDFREIPNNVSLAGEGRHSLLLQLLLPGRSLLLLSLGIAGLLVQAARAWRRRPVGVLLLYYFIAAYWAATALFYILSRFRAPILPLVAAAAGGWASWMIRAWRRKPRERRRTLLLGGGALLAGVWLTGYGYETYRNGCEAAVMRLVRPQGSLLTFPDGATERFDYGPQTFGGWNLAELRNGTRLVKRFPGAAGRGEVQLTLLSETAGRFQLEVNGAPITAEADGPGLTVLKFPATPGADGTVAIRMLRVSGRHALIFDAQRNYGRSKLDGAPLNGEWVIRFRQNGAR